MLFAVGFTDAKAVVTVEKIRIIAASRHTALFAEKCIYVSVSFYKCFLRHLQQNDNRADTGTQTQKIVTIVIYKRVYVKFVFRYRTV